MRSDLPFVTRPGTSAGMAPPSSACTTTMCPCLDHLVYFDTEIRHGPQQAAPDLFKTTPNRHEAFLAIRKVSSLCAVSAKSQHAFDIMSVIGGEKLSGDRLHIVVFIHSHFP